MMLVGRPFRYKIISEVYMTIQTACYILQLLEILFLCRRKKIPAMLLSASCYCVLVYAIEYGRRHYVSKLLSYLLAVGISLHYVLLITVSIYICIWCVSVWIDSDFIYNSQSYVLFISLILTAYGFASGLNPHLSSYEIYSDKVNDDVRIVHISDLHISSMYDGNDISKLVNYINILNPDIICITGDVFDNRSSLDIDLNLVYREFKRLGPKYGTYVCQGNHDIKINDALIELCDESGFTYLVDESKVLNDFEIIGRKCSLVSDDLCDIIETNDKFKIVLDHIPNKIEESADNDVDLQLSGHTHGGQLFPITYKFKKSYGVCTGANYFGDTFVVISQGSRLVYPYCRIEGMSEIICIDVKRK